MRLLPLLMLLGGCDPGAAAKSRDADQDGYVDGEDCDDGEASVHVGATEVCDGLDNDCNGAVDDAPVNLRVYYADADGDGHADPDAPVYACTAPAGTLVVGDDCDDGRADVHPGAVEVCDAVDQDCDGAVDEDAADVVWWYDDADGDGYGDGATGVRACGPTAGQVADATDCDDTNALVHPTAPESDCTDPVDYNCDGSAARVDADGDGLPACEDCDDGDPAATTPLDWYADADGDGWGDAAAGLSACAAPAGYVAGAGDCDDADGGRHPGAAEVCDPADTDEDCSGLADDADPGVDSASRTGGSLDADGDGFGDPATTVDRCDLPAGYVASAGDCDDTRPDVSPDGSEVCDDAGSDEDCDALVDDADPSVGGGLVWYLDGDGDGYGAGASLVACTSPAGAVASATDCDDADASANPDGVEVCDGQDDDCDGATDEGVTATFWADADGDTWGDPSVTTSACAAPEGYVDNDGDCDDTDALVYPDGKAFCAPTSADTGSVPSTSDTGRSTTTDSGGTDDSGGGFSDSGDTASATAIRFIVVGDTGDGSTAQYEVAAGMETVCASEGCDFVLLVGDNFYPDGVTSTSDPLWTTAFEDPYADLDLQFRAVMGNHDWNHTQDTMYLDAQVDYSAVSAKWSMPADYFTFVEGDVTFYGIDTWLISEGAGADQEAWLPGERAASTTTWNLIYGHHPYISNGPHGNADPPLQDFVDTYVCGQYDVYFCGHDHNLQWLEETCGTTFMVSGAGHSTYGLYTTNAAAFQVQSLGFLWVEIDGNRFTGVFYDQDGVELYRGTITK